MTKERQYLLDIGMEDSADVEEIEELLQDILTELYNQGEVESIRVTKGSVPDTKDVNELVDIIEDVENRYIRQAIESVRAMEKFDDG